MCPLLAKSPSTMPISEFSQISLSQIFQELPSLVNTDGLFVEVNGFSHAASYVGDIGFRVTTYTGTNGRLKESRLQRKMAGLRATPSPCSFCPPALRASKGAVATPEILAPDTCPLCLTASATPGWVKQTTMVNVRVHHSGKIEATSSQADILTAFLQPLFTAQVKYYEEHRENIERVAAEAAKAKEERLLRQRRNAVDERT
jgi:hypothetical protein